MHVNPNDISYLDPKTPLNSAYNAHIIVKNHGDQINKYQCYININDIRYLDNVLVWDTQQKNKGARSRRRNRNTVLGVPVRKFWSTSKK
jgi:hypothetical protein